MRFLCWEINRIDTIRQLLKEGQKIKAIGIYRKKYPALSFKEVLTKFYHKYLPGQPVPGGAHEVLPLWWRLY